MKTLSLAMLAMIGVAQAESTMEYGTRLGADVGQATEIGDKLAPQGLSAFVRGGIAFRLGEHAWVEPGGGVRINDMKNAAHGLELGLDVLAGVRIGTRDGVTRPWLGAYTGFARRSNTLGSEDGVALVAAGGIDFAIGDSGSRILLGARIDVAADYIDRSGEWYALGLGLTYSL
jgi:hypothetical protein